MSNTTATPRLALNSHTRTAATRIRNLATRHSGSARAAWIKECEAGCVTDRTRAAHIRWERMAERATALRHWMNRDGEEAAAALSLCLDIALMYRGCGDRSWNYVIRSVEALAEYLA